MDIRLTKNGRVFYRVDPTLAAILCEALPSVFERVEPAPKPAHIANAESAAIRNVATPEWSVGLSAFDHAVITLRAGRTELSYAGSAEGAADNFKRAGYSLPKDVLESYIRLLKRPVPSVTISDEERARIQDAELAQKTSRQW